MTHFRQCKTMFSGWGSAQWQGVWLTNVRPYLAQAPAPKQMSKNTAAGNPQDHNDCPPCHSLELQGKTRAPAQARTSVFPTSHQILSTEFHSHVSATRDDGTRPQIIFSKLT